MTTFILHEGNGIEDPSFMYIAHHNGAIFLLLYFNRTSLVRRMSYERRRSCAYRSITRSKLVRCIKDLSKYLKVVFLVKYI